MDTFDALRLLVSIADTGSLTAAARQQSVATSTVTLALQQLEEQLHTRLIHRTTRKLTFTHEGEQFLADAKQLLLHWEDSTNRLQQEETLKGPIRITATCDFGRVRLVPMIDLFNELHPEVDIYLHLGDGVVDMIENNIDLALRNGPLIDSNLRSRALVYSQRLICATPGYWEKYGKPEHPDCLANHNCLILHRTGVNYASWPFLIDGKVISIRVTGNRSANDSAVLRHWTMKGYGVMLKHRWEIQRELEHNLLSTALDDYALPHVDLYAVTSSGQSSKRVFALIDFLAEQMRLD
jgi:DNA-binding transcriptional LysR family regulator